MVGGGGTGAGVPLNLADPPGSNQGPAPRGDPGDVNAAGYHGDRSFTDHLKGVMVSAQDLLFPP